MQGRLPKLAIVSAASFLLFTTPAVAQVSPSTPKAARVRIIQRPQIELAKEHLTIIRWTTNNPGGSPVHYGIVRYGTDPQNLGQTASSPIRLNPDHPLAIFRVRLDGLQPATTYYYTVGSMEANGKGDGALSPVRRFTTSAAPRRQERRPAVESLPPSARRQGRILALYELRDVAGEPSACTVRVLPCAQELV